jgi:LysM repeat protein
MRLAHHIAPNLKGLILLTACLCSSFYYSADAQAVDSVSIKYPWIRTDANIIQFHDFHDLEMFYDRWKLGNDSLITIAHFGDSHIQPDIFTGELRNRLQQSRGFGGLGMMFPFSTARTYSTINYFSRHTGEWKYSKSIEIYPRMTLGVSGATSRTADPKASFTIEFRKQQPSSYRHLKLYIKPGRTSYDVMVSSAGNQVFVAVNDSIRRPYYDVELPSLGNTITIQLVKRNAYENEFEFYGMSLESIEGSGLIYHSLGIGGSMYGSLLKQVLLDAQLETLNANLIVLDFGTNDYLYENRITAQLESQIIRVIAKVRSASPNASVLLTTTQDMNRKGSNISAGIEFSALIRKIARSQKCAFYDWYWISGGPGKMSRWEQSGLAQTDNIHLTTKGYNLKGRLLAEAFMKCIALFENEPRPDSVIVDLTSLRKNIAKNDSIASLPDSVRKKPGVIQMADPDLITHVVSKGETLRAIAKKYKAKLEDIKKLNGLKNSKIAAGDSLKIRLGKQPAPVIPKVVNQPTVEYVLHKVQKEETLSELAEKYKVSVGQLKNLNGLKTSRIKAGQTLKIKVKTDRSTGR